MNIVIKTEVAGNYKEIMRRFDLDLFEALKPKNAKMEIVKFTGSNKGDIVHLQFHKPLKVEWISEIVEVGEDERKAYFIDEGVKLPKPLSYWRHKHIVEKISDDRSYIIDDISYKASNPILTSLMYPVIYAGFYPRKGIYKKYFS